MMKDPRPATADRGPFRHVRRTYRCWKASVLEGVLHVLAGRLDVGRHLVALALGLETLVVGALADGLLDLADQVFSRVLDLVCRTHDGLPSVADHCASSHPARILR